MEILEAIAENLRFGEASKVEELVQAALDDGVDVDDVLQGGLISGMTTVGILFRDEEMFLPEVMLSAKAMDAGMAILEPLLLLKHSGKKKEAKIVLGTVVGDVHSIGKNLVGIMLKGAGFEVEDLGVNVSPEKFVEAAAGGAQIVGMSALLTTTMRSMKTNIEALDSAGLRGKVKILVGGAVLTQKYADEIGADGYAPDAGSVVDKVKELLEQLNVNYLY
jgi:5-methyltetrahydrofolate--homocysteine methyltransferase|tara:strand:+ start:218 stop:877 length:660 start_codon:yes stop_codon:yes gene_type:complete